MSMHMAPKTITTTGDVGMYPKAADPGGLAARLDHRRLMSHVLEAPQEIVLGISSCRLFSFMTNSMWAANMMCGVQEWKQDILRYNCL